jgi:competence CoiA-like predicted nuclease
MENSLFRGKLICTYDLKDENGIYYEDTVLEWKEAAADRSLHCVDCGAPVYLAAGPIKEPYFAHYDIEECEYGSGQESEELKKGKRLLYHLLKQSLPDSNIQARYRLENGMYCTLFCDNGNQPIAMDYRLVNNSLQKFRLRDDYYQAHQIKVIYILGKRQNKETKQLDWYQNLIQSVMGMLAFLDIEKEQLILKRSFGYRLGKERHFKYCIKAYPIRELSMDNTGRMLCDFDILCNTMEQQIEEEKIKYDREQENLRKLREEKLRLEQEEQMRMDAYRRQQTSNLMGTSNVADQGEARTLIPEVRASMKLIKHNDEEILALGLNISLYHKCVTMIEHGDGHLVAKKYYDLITGLR